MSDEPKLANDHAMLRRELGTFAAVMMGLGSIIGTGVFVTIGIAAGIAGPAIIISIAIAAFVASCNALNSAQLAASHPVSGGTYEYGYKYLRPWLGFSAGWMFLCAKSASAATSALGFSGYLLSSIGYANPSRILLVIVAVATVLALVGIVLGGMRQSSGFNITVVSITLIALLAFCVVGLPLALSAGARNLTDFSGTVAQTRFWPGILQATALMFVAYTGYGRIATLGEEVHEPRRTIPRAIIVTLIVSAALYIAVAAVAIASTGAANLGELTQERVAPLQLAARNFHWPQVQWIVALGAMTAMIGVLLNLILGLSRVVLAMGRRGDMPAALGRLDPARPNPVLAIVLVGVVILGITLVGNVKVTWSFSAFTVLVYYAITNLAALFLPASQRMYGRWFAVAGLAACLFLAFWVEPRIWMIGLLIFAAGIVWHAAAQYKIRMKRIAMVMLMGLFLTACASAPRGGFEQTTVFVRGTDGYLSYRIPAAIVTPRGTLLAFCEGRQTPIGPGNDTGEIDLIVKRSTDNGRTFSEHRVVWADGSNTCGNPCPVIDQTTGTIWLLMTHNLGEDHERDITRATARGTRTVWVTSSTDDGLTWSAPRQITADVKKADWTWYATGPGVGIQIKHGPHAGRLVIPCDYVLRGGGPDTGNSHVIYSDDHGQTWKLGGEAPARQFNESQIVELPGGRLMLNMRNHTGVGRAKTPRQRGVALSDDGGQTFHSLYRDETLVEPICQASILRYSWPGEKGRSRILFSNPASTDERMAMTVRLSYDEGKTWPVARVVHGAHSAYSCLVALPDGTIGLLYEAGDESRYERIDFARFTLGWLTDGADTLRGADEIATPRPSR